MIVTVTANPALDKTSYVDEVHPGRLHRLSRVLVSAGGKGINVAGMVRTLEGQVVATGLCGGSVGEEFLRRLEQAELPADFVRCKGQTRTNLKLVDRSGGLTEFNEPGPLVPAEEWDTLYQKLLGYAGKGAVFALSGSLPQGVSAGAYRDLIVLLKERGCAVLLDADGEAFSQALAAGPYAVKPNRAELLAHFGLPPGERLSIGQLAGHCRRLLERGVELVALSLGEEGALFCTRDGVWRAEGLAVPVRSTVGAGDSMLGALAFALERGMSDREAFRLALAASAGAVTTEGTTAPALPLVRELERQVSLTAL